jgi:hypothetical protein
MKALKLAMVAVLIACTTVCLASTDGIKEKPNHVYNVTLLKALSIPGLADAIMEQVDFGFLKVEAPTYTVEVTLERDLYRITGTRAQWLAFYKPIWIKSEIKPAFGTPKK